MGNDGCVRVGAGVDSATGVFATDCTTVGGALASAGAAYVNKEN